MGAWLKDEKPGAASPIAAMDWRLRPGALNDAARIYECVTGDQGNVTRRSANIAWRIENSLAHLGWPTDTMIGSEALLAETFSVSREVIREAIRIGEGRGSLTMRRGRCGGLIVCNPLRQRVSWVLAEHLSSCGATLEQLREACEALDPLVIANAAVSSGPWDDNDQGATANRTAFREAVADRVDHPVLALFWDMATQLGLSLSSKTAPHESLGKTGDTLRYERWISQAIQRKDACQAARLSARQVRESWPFDPSFSGSQSIIQSSEDPRFTGSNTVPARANAIASELIKELRTLSAGARLGSEWDLCIRFSVGRPIMRQALRVLEDIGIVESRRGRSGGIIRSEPTRSAVVRLAFPYIAAGGEDDLGLLDLVWHLNLASLRVAGVRIASMGMEERQSHLDRFRKRISTRRDTNRWVAIPQTISEIGGNEVLHLLQRILVGYAARSFAHQPTSKPFQQSLLDKGVRVVEALLGAEVALAEELLNECQEAIGRNNASHNH